jgi:hypothetical protein
VISHVISKRDRDLLERAGEYALHTRFRLICA